MKKTLLITIFTFFALLGCNVKSDVSVFEQKNFEGIVYYTDTILKAPQRTATEATIFLATNTEADPFITKHKANKEGNFSVDFVPKRGDFLVVGKWKDSRGILFQNAMAYNAQTNLILYPRYPKGKIKVTVRDANKQPVNEVDVFLFVNNELAKSVAAGEAKGHIKKETTNENGIAFFYDLAPNTYYVAGRREKQIFDVVTTTTTVDFTDYKTINHHPVTLVTPALASVKLSITVEDAAMKPMIGSEVLVFANATQAETARSAKKPTGVLESQLTDATGKVFFRTLADNTDYFVIARDSLYDASTQKLRAAFSKITPLKTTSTATITIP